MEGAKAKIATGIEGAKVKIAAGMESAPWNERAGDCRSASTESLKGYIKSSRAKEDEHWRGRVIAKNKYKDRLRKKREDRQRRIVKIS